MPADFVIRNAAVGGGSGSPGFSAGVEMKDAVIASIGPEGAAADWTDLDGYLAACMARRPADKNTILAGHNRVRAYVVRLVLVDAATVEDLATYADPNQEPAGISNVIANGQVACGKGRNTGTSAAEMVRFRRAVP